MLLFGYTGALFCVGGTVVVLQIIIAYSCVNVKRARLLFAEVGKKKKDISLEKPIEIRVGIWYNISVIEGRKSDKLNAKNR